MAKRETVITKEIAILEKTLAKAPEKVKIKIRAKIARLKKEAKGIPMTAKQLANNVLRQKQKIKQLSKTDFNSLIRQLSKKPEYSFLKSMTKDEIVRDIARKAKPVGWRYKGKGDYRNPTKRDIANRKSTGVYWEARRNRSDVSQAAQLEKGGKVTPLKVKSIRYFETNRGTGYQAKTNIPGVEIVNDGTGGPTYVKGMYRKTKPYEDLRERELENLLDQFEGIKAKGGKMEQGYNDRMDESLGMRHRGPKSQSHKDRRDEAKGMNKAMGDRAYQSVGTMDKMAKGGKLKAGQRVSVFASPLDGKGGGYGTITNVTSEGVDITMDDGSEKSYHKDFVSELGSPYSSPFRLLDRRTKEGKRKMDKGGYLRIKEILGEDTPWLGTVEDDTPYEEKDGLRYVWYDGDQTTSNVTQVLKRFGLSKQKINDDIKRKGLKKRWVFDDGFAHLTVMFPDKKENGGEIEIEEPEIVRYYFEDDGYEYENGGEIEIEEPQIVRYYFEDDAFEYDKGGRTSDKYYKLMESFRKDAKKMKFRLESAHSDLKRVAKFVDSNPMVKKAMDKTVNGFNIDSALGDALVATDLSDDEVFEFKVNGKSFEEYNYEKGGKLKSIPADNKGLPKLPKSVRNKMGYMADGGKMEQGYDDREDESLGMRTGRESSKKQGMKARRDDSYGKFGKRDMEDRGISLKRGGKSDDWIQKVTESDNFKKGAFRAQAKRAGMSTEDFAKKVLSNPSKYSKLTRERASLAKTLMGFKK